jgi:hypothetical protein
MRSLTGALPPEGPAGTSRHQEADEGLTPMPKHHRSAKEEERYWRFRAGLEIAKLVFDVVWDILRRGGGTLL